MPLSAMVVWIEMLPDDRQADLSSLMKSMDDPRIRWFHDPGQRGGKRVAAALGAPGRIAWDVYLFFDRAAQWKGDLPKPHGWAHQLGDAWADPAHFHPGDQLHAELSRLLKEASR